MAKRWDEGVGVVTPEAVPLQFSEAGVGSRGIALLIDFAILIATLLALNAFLGYLIGDTASPLPEWVVIATTLVTNFLVYFGYWIGFETLMHGRTPGKIAMGLRVVTVEGSPVRFRHAAARAALGQVDFTLTVGVAAVLATLLSKRSQRLGDMVAGTVVLRERSAAGPPRAAQFRVPDGAEAYAASLDVSGLSPQEYETIREYLIRAWDLAPAARMELARRLAVGIAAKLRHHPPPYVNPPLFLQCVAARYQQRVAAGAPPPVQQPWATPLEPRGSQPAPPPSAAQPPPPAPTPAPSWDDFAPPS